MARNGSCVVDQQMWTLEVSRRRTIVVIEKTSGRRMELATDVKSLVVGRFRKLVADYM